MALKESKKLEQANSFELLVKVDGETFEKALNAVYKKEVKKINIPGFRKGKAPRHVIEKMYGKEVFYDDAMQDCYPEALYNAAEEAGVKIVAVESIEVTEAENGFTFKANIIVEPEMEINNYLGIEVTKKSTEVTDELIDEEIEKVRDRNSRMVTVEDRPVANGDIAVIDFEGFVDGVAFEGGKAENYNLAIGSGNFIPGFEEQIVGHNTDEEFSINVKFPEEYQAEELAGKDAEFKIKLHEIKAKELPELDDEFAQDVAGVDTLAEYKEEIKKNLTEKKETEAKKSKEDEAIQKIIDKSKMDLPEAMIETQCETMVEEFAQRIAQSGLTMEQYLQFSGMTVDQLKDQVRPEATTRIQSSLVLAQIAKEENIEVTDADIDAEVEKMAKAYGMEADKLKEYMGDAEKESMKKDLAITKAVDLVMDNVKERAKAKKKADAEESTEE